MTIDDMYQTPEGEDFWDFLEDQDEDEELLDDTVD